MKYLFLCIIFALAGCAGSPPKPRDCAGEFRPVNASEKRGALIDVDMKLALCHTGAKA